MDFTEDNLLTFCRDSVDIEGCARTHLETSLTLFELFDIMTRDVARLERMCEVSTLDIRYNYLKRSIP